MYKNNYQRILKVAIVNLKMYIVEYIKIPTKHRQANFTNTTLVCIIYTFKAPVSKENNCTIMKLLSLLTFTSQTFNKRKIEK